MMDGCVQPRSTAEIDINLPRANNYKIIHTFRNINVNDAHERVIVREALVEIEPNELDSLTCSNE